MKTNAYTLLIVIKVAFAILIITSKGVAQVRNFIPNDTRKTDLVEVIQKHFQKEDKVKEDKVVKVKQANKKLYLSFVPVSTKRRGGKKVFVSSFNSAFYLGKSDSTYLSNISLEPSTNFSNKFGLGYRFNLWTKNNTWNIPGDINLSNLDSFTWGLGANTVDADKYQIATKSIKLYFSLNRDWHKTNLFFYGMGINYDRFYNLAPGVSPTNPSSFEKYGVGTSESLFSSGISFSALYDNRRNSVNPMKGTYATAIFRTNPALMGNALLWSSLYMDVRRYIPLTAINGKRRILAVWAMYWGTYGSVPYLNLPSTSQDLNGQTGRGYTFARFRGKEMLYCEAEYRFDITQNGLFGGVVFANVESFTEPDTNQFTYALPAGGFGARIKINKKSNTNLGLDFGFGKDGFNFNAQLGEAF